MGLLYLFTICWVVFSLDWVCFTFRIDVGLFCGLALLQIFFFFQILVQIFFFFFFNLIVFLVLLKGEPHLF